MRGSAMNAVEPDASGLNLGEGNRRIDKDTGARADPAKKTRYR